MTDSIGSDGETLSRLALDTLSSNVAVLDSEGVIVRSNRSWREFGRENGLAAPIDAHGTDYLAVCDRADDGWADEAAAGIRAVLAGEEETFELEYPCHSETERRWFLLRVTRFERGGEPYAVVAHSDITERTLAEREAERRAEELAEERETLALLNQIVRHDIRNDMSVILGWAEVLADHVDDEGRESLDRIVESGSHVVELTTTVGELAETLTDDDAVDLRPVDLAAVIREEADKLVTAYEGRAETVTVEVDDLPEVCVLADELLSSVFANLLSNAVLHNDEAEPRVEVSAEVDGEAATVRVADNGPGIPDELVGSVFGRGEKGLESPGTGLGLYLVDTLVRRYGGDVRLGENEPKGTVVEVDLDLA